MLWSDPTLHIALFYENDRGKGYKFGFQAANDFLTSTGLSLIIRAHECVNKGVDIKNNIITVFSSSNYAAVKNKAAILSYCNNQLNPIILPEIEPFPKKDVNFFDVIMPKQGQLSKEGSNLSMDHSKLMNLSSSALKLIPSTKSSLGAKARIRIKSLTPAITRSSITLTSARKHSATVIPKLCVAIPKNNNNNEVPEQSLPKIAPIQE